MTKFAFYVSPSGKIHARFKNQRGGFCGYVQSFIDDSITAAQANGSKDLCQRCARKLYDLAPQDKPAPGPKTKLKKGGRGGRRPGAGRPPAGTARRSSKVFARLSKDELEYVFNASKKKAEGLSEFVRRACLLRAQQVIPQKQLFVEPE